LISPRQCRGPAGRRLCRHAQDITDQQIRDGLIQRFEFTYDLSDKMLKRFLEETSATPEAIDLLSFQSRIRTGSEQDLLLNDWRWNSIATCAMHLAHLRRCESA
jgi:hypothetical protein